MSRNFVNPSKHLLNVARPAICRRQLQTDVHKLTPQLKETMNQPWVIGTGVLLVGAVAYYYYTMKATPRQPPPGEQQHTEISTSKRN